MRAAPVQPAFPQGSNRLPFHAFSVKTGKKHMGQKTYKPKSNKRGRCPFKEKIFLQLLEHWGD